MWVPIHLPYLLDNVPPKFNFLFPQQANLIGPSLQKMKL